MKPIHIVCLVVILGFSVGQTNGQSTSGFVKRYHSYQGITIPLYTFIPATYDSVSSYPLVLCLHGAGERGDDSTVVQKNSMATVWADSANQSTWPSIVVVPQCPVDTWWSDPLMLSTLNDVLDSLLTDFRIDTNRLYLTGLSMGGYGTWDLAVRYPNRFAAAVPVCGHGDPSKASVIRRLPIWAFHGANDPVVLVAGSRAMVAAIEKTGIITVRTAGLPDSILAHQIQTGVNLLYTEYPTGGHDIWNDAYHHPLLLPWVFSKSRAATGMLTYTRNVEVWPLTPERNRDTVTIRATVDNPGGHALVVTALVIDLGSGETKDSLQLLDDGAHSDGLPDDGLWGGVFVPVPEGVYSVSARAVDPSVTMPSILANTAFFATAGPIAVDGYAISSSDTVAGPGKTMTYIIALKNTGSTATIPNVTAKVRTLDTTVILQSVVLAYGDIAPGQSSVGTGTQRLRYSASGPGNYVVQFSVEISSNGVVYWQGTFADLVTGVGEPEGNLPKVFALEQNYPNPFNPSTTIRYGLPHKSAVLLTVFNTLGQQVATLVQGEQEAGYHEVRFDASRLSSGVYFYRLQAGTYVETRKLLLLR